MATLYLLADETVKNPQEQDCRLVVIIYAPDGSDSGALRKEAENKIKEGESAKSLRSAKGLRSDSPIRTQPLSICERTRATPRAH